MGGDHRCSEIEHVVLELGDVDENEATADVLLVELVTSTLDVVFLVDKDNRVSGQPASGHLNLDVCVLDVEVREELSHVSQSCFEWQTCKLDCLADVVSVDNLAQIDRLVLLLVRHEALVLSIAGSVELDPA